MPPWKLTAKRIPAGRAYPQKTAPVNGRFIRGNLPWLTAAYLSEMNGLWLRFTP